MANKGQMDNDVQNTSITQKAKYRVTRIPLKTKGKLSCCGRIPSPLEVHVELLWLQTPVICHECEKNREVLTASGYIFVVICDTDVPQQLTKS